jgi:soluble lytic murein transglycosylase-like protein
MQIRLSQISTGLLLVIGTALPIRAQETIHAFMNSNGKVVFTNLVERVPEPATPASAPVAAAPNSIEALADSISANHGVDPALVRAVIRTESNFNRFAVSNKGALGLMQLIPSTGRRFGVRDFFDPQQNIDGGVRYLKFLLEKFNGNLDLSLAAYNAGENLVQRLGRVPAIPETRNYVRKVLGSYRTKSTPLTAPTAAQAPSSTPAAAPVSASEPPKIYRTVDARGVVHFSNIEPPN